MSNTRDDEPGGGHGGLTFSMGDTAKLHAWLNDGEAMCRARTSDRYFDQIEHLKQGLLLLSQPFLPNRVAVLPPHGDTVELEAIRASVEFRLASLAHAVTTERAAIDLCLAGQYSQAFALLRTLYEGWKRICACRRQPMEVFRWFPASWLEPRLRKEVCDRKLDAEISKKDWNRIFPSADENPPREFDLKILQFAKARVKYLDAHVHPTMESTMPRLVREDGQRLRYRTVLQAQFLQDMCERCLKGFRETLEFLIYELQQLVPLSTEWVSALERWGERGAIFLAKGT